MGKIGVLRDRWSALSRLGRVALVGAVAVTGLAAGSALDRSGSKPPAPVVWRDHLADQAH